MSFKSITGIVVNDPNVCIGSNTGFACICAKCSEERAVLFRTLFAKSERT